MKSPTFTIPPSVQKPSRYAGCEILPPMRPWDETRTRILLAFPDVYEIGMSYLGIHLLHAVLNAREGTRAERVFAPWADYEEALRASGETLRSLESHRPLRDFDLVGFSLTYELGFTNVLTMLSLSGIPFRREDRREEDPVVIAGGVCTLNPAPIAPFFDALLVGDGEEAVLEIVSALEAAKAKGLTRSETIASLASIDGVLVPGLSTTVRRRILPDLAKSPLSTAPIVPSMRIVHDRLSLEISRGCTRGCRFCQAGYVYRPIRERDPHELLEHLRNVAPHTGFDEVGLLSLSAADYGCIDGVIAAAMETLSPERISVSLPSLRLDALKESTVEQIRKVRKTGFTLAPEAGTERLRRAVNKGITDEEILRTADFIYANGWTTMKLYFMVGLPGETPDDVRAIPELVRRIAGVAKRHGKRNAVNAAVSCFIPKPHTPFQWERQISREEAAERIQIVRAGLSRDRNAEVKFGSPAVSELEGVFSRGDARLADAIVSAWRYGARFDGWTETFRPEAWTKAFAEHGIEQAAYLAERSVDANLPWDVVDCGVTKAFLLSERGKANDGTATPDCRLGECSACGVCVPGTGNVLHGDPALPTLARKVEIRAALPFRPILRIVYAKTGPARFLSGLEVQGIWARVLRRAGVPVAHSHGFNPHPKIAFGPALPVGTESDAEYLEMELDDLMSADAVSRALVSALPTGLSVVRIASVAPGSPRISDGDLVSTYLVALRPPATEATPSAWPDGVSKESVDAAFARLASVDAFPVTIAREGKDPAVVDAKPLVTGFSMTDEGVLITIVQGTGRGIRPLDAASALMGLPFSADDFSVRKTVSTPVTRR